MKIEKLKAEISSGNIDVIRLRRNPDNLSNWFCSIKTTDHNMHILVDNDEQTIISGNLDMLALELKQTGVKEAEIIF
ncbi:MAG: hypothetical protein ACI9T7_002330 [Oleiphilaceae bacterium]|jgi:hypothetical protein